MDTTIERDARARELITTKDAAKVLNVSARTVNRMCIAGAIKAVKVGRQWRVNSEALRTFATLS